MQTPKDRPAAPDLREYLAVFRRRKWSIALITCVTIASALAFSFRQTPMYRSEARVLVRPITTGIESITPVNLETERSLASSYSVAAVVVEETGTRRSPDDLLGSLEVSVETSTEILAIAFSDPDPAAAQDYSAAFANAYLEFRRSSAQRQLQVQIGGVEKQIESTQGTLADLEQQIRDTKDPAELTQLTTERNSLIGREVYLRQQLADLNIQLTTVTKSGEVVQPAGLATTPYSPNHVRNGALALVVGLALGVGLAFLRERLDEGIRDRSDLEAAIGAPVLAIVPKVAGWKKRDRTQLASIGEPKGAAAEAYRTLRTNLQFIARRGDFKVLSVTSPTAGEGKTTTAANLAVALAQAGKHVIAVSCDLRKPRLHRFFDLRNDSGVTSILVGDATLASAAQATSIPTLRILASGPMAPNPSDLLGSDEMADLLDEMRRVADFVILDTAPVLAVSDALILAPASDGVLVVADASSSSRGAISHLREQLDQVESKVIGTVLNNFDPSHAKYYPSSYSYRYSYQYRYAPESDEGDTTNGRKARRAEARRSHR